MKSDNPTICVIIKVIAWLSLLGGIIGGIICLSQYTPLIVTGITYIVSGTISATLF